MKRMMMTVAAAGVLLAGSAVAETRWGLGAKVGTLGLGAEVTTAVTPQFGARLGFNTFSRSDTRTESGIRYDADLQLQNTTLMLDWHPFEGGFRTTVGYLFSDNEIDLESKSTGAVDIGGTTYNIGADNFVNGTIDLGSGAYVGIGYGSSRAGWSLTADLGVVFQGRPDASLNTDIPGVTDADLSEEEDDLEEDFDEFDRYPVIAIGASYGF